MKKINKTKYIKGFDLEYDLNEFQDIKGIIESLEVLLDQGATHISFYKLEWAEDVEICPYALEEETDEEFEARKEQIKIAKEARARIELAKKKAQYEELKSIFEN